MRHLIVPSVDTQRWFEVIKSNGWAEEGIGILTTDDGLKAIPVNSSAPSDSDVVWQGLKIKVIARSDNVIKHWTDLIDQETIFSPLPA